MGEQCRIGLLWIRLFTLNWLSLSLKSIMLCNFIGLESLIPHRLRLKLLAKCLDHLFLFECTVPVVTEAQESPEKADAPSYPVVVFTE